jgi:hypothetical protein
MEPIKTDGGLQVAGAEQDAGEHAVVAALTQTFTGLRVGLPSLEVHCCRCDAQLGDGDEVSVYAYRTVETPRWHLARCRCLDCAPDDIATPTLGATEVRISARLAVISDAGAQQHQLCLTKPTTNAVSSPQDGTAPTDGTR